MPSTETSERAIARDHLHQIRAHVSAALADLAEGKNVAPEQLGEIGHSLRELRRASVGSLPCRGRIPA